MSRGRDLFVFVRGKAMSQTQRPVDSPAIFFWPHLTLFQCRYIRPDLHGVKVLTNLPKRAVSRRSWDDSVREIEAAQFGRDKRIIAVITERRLMPLDAGADSLRSLRFSSIGCSANSNDVRRARLIYQSPWNRTTVACWPA